jgi:hypothetical protein
MLLNNNTNNKEKMATVIKKVGVYLLVGLIILYFALSLKYILS